MVSLFFPSLYLQLSLKSLIVFFLFFTLSMQSMTFFARALLVRRSSEHSVYFGGLDGWKAKVVYFDFELSVYLFRP